MPTSRPGDDARDHEVVRANRELAAYFRGRRTEREARAALKIIKAFIRDRQRTPVERRRPLPGVKTPPAAPKRPKKRAPARVRPIRAPQPVPADATHPADE